MGLGLQPLDGRCNSHTGRFMVEAWGTAPQSCPSSVNITELSCMTSDLSAYIPSNRYRQMGDGRTEAPPLSQPAAPFDFDYGVMLLPLLYSSRGRKSTTILALPAGFEPATLALGGPVPSDWREHIGAANGIRTRVILIESQGSCPIDDRRMLLSVYIEALNVASRTHWFVREGPMHSELALGSHRVGVEPTTSLALVRLPYHSAERRAKKGPSYHARKGSPVFGALAMVSHCMVRLLCWMGRQGSNPRPSGSEPDATTD